MTPPAKLSDIGMVVVEKNAEWDLQDVDDAAEALKALNKGDHGRVADLLTNIVKRNMNAISSQTWMLADKQAHAEMVVMNANAALAATGLPQAVKGIAS